MKPRFDRFNVEIEIFSTVQPKGDKVQRVSFRDMWGSWKHYYSISQASYERIRYYLHNRPNVVAFTAVKDDGNYYEVWDRYFLSDVAELSLKIDPADYWDAQLIQPNKET